MNARLTGAQSFNGYILSYNPGEGAVEGDLPSGSYSLALSSYGPQQGFAAVTLHVAGAPLRTAPVTLSPPSSVAVHVQVELSAAAANSAGGAQGLQGQNGQLAVNVRLQPTDYGAGGVAGNSHPGAESDFLIENVPPGTYTASAQLFPGYAAAMSCGGVDLLQHPLEVGVEGVRDPIQITLRDDTGELTGKVTGTDSPGRGTVVLLPLDASGRLSSGFLRPDGSFVANNIPPGNYRLLAGTGQPAQIAYREEQTQRLLANKGQVIAIQPGGKQTADAMWVGDLNGLVP